MMGNATNKPPNAVTDAFDNAKPIAIVTEPRIKINTMSHIFSKILSDIVFSGYQNTSIGIPTTTNHPYRISKKAKLWDDGLSLYFYAYITRTSNSVNCCRE